METKQERVLIVGAHALDFLWRCGGTIAQYAKNGSEVKIIDLTYGDRGESNDVWKQNPGITHDEVRQIRRKEAETTAGMLGASIEFMEWEDHLLEMNRERTLELSRKMMEFQPTILLTHFTADPLNYDHPVTANAVLSALRCAQVSGTFPDLTPCGWVKVFMFEPAQPEFVGFNPNAYVDITDVVEDKIAAMQSTRAQEYLISTYTARAGYRGYLAKRISHDKKVKAAEAFVRFNPWVGKLFC
ncbi:PIG-L deacetylase family protein [Hominifimenecus sp. rT4P-3]|uniref:PIG-L deacetylase family protein n=1 Tax=Hominifimenecus sp. rT4P-3 TaxID=3242979 RepID=UPI003DA35FB6